MLTLAAQRRLAAGFTLIEVLVTLVVLMFGLLGMAGLMVRGQRATYEAYQRQQALAIATEIAERMRANSANAAAYAAAAPVGTPLGEGNRFLSIGTAVPNCAGDPLACRNNGAALAAYDTAMWDGLLAGVTELEIATGLNVGGLANARGCIVPAGGAAILGAGITGTVWRVQVAWQGRDATTAPAVGLNCGAGQYGAETLRRVVAVDVIGVQ